MFEFRRRRFLIILVVSVVALLLGIGWLFYVSVGAD